MSKLELDMDDHPLPMYDEDEGYCVQIDPDTRGSDEGLRVNVYLDDHPRTWSGAVFQPGDVFLTVYLGNKIHKVLTMDMFMDAIGMFEE